MALASFVRPSNFRSILNLNRASSHIISAQSQRISKSVLIATARSSFGSVVSPVTATASYQQVKWFHNSPKLQDSSGFVHGSLVQYVPLKTEHIVQCTRILADAFSHRKSEPVCAHIDRDDFTFFAQHYLAAAAQVGRSTVAMDASVEPWHVASLVIASDFLDHTDEMFRQELKLRNEYGFDRIFELFNDLDAKFVEEMKQQGDYVKGKIWCLWLGGTKEGYLHQDLHSTLLIKNLEMARKEGYKYALAECTTEWSKHALEKCGATIHTTLKYADWEYPKGSGDRPMKHWESEKERSQANLMVISL